jgi:LysM repeat protein
MIAVTVQSGDTLSGIASANGVSLAVVETANPQISNPNLIFTGETVNIPVGSGPAPAPLPPAPVSSPSNLGAPAGSFQACVIQRESGGDATAVNPSSGAGGLYQFLPSTWASLGYSGLPQNAPVSEQTQAFNTLYAEDGSSPWAPSDNC